MIKKEAASKVERSVRALTRGTEKQEVLFEFGKKGGEERATQKLKEVLRHYQCPERNHTTDFLWRVIFLSNKNRRSMRSAR